LSGELVFLHVLHGVNLYRIFRDAKKPAHAPVLRRVWLCGCLGRVRG
jgi:hypothetical protein